MFPSNSYMEPYFSQNKEQVPYHPSYPFYPYPVPSRPDPSSQPASYAPWPYHFNPMHSNGYLYPPGYYGSRPPFPYELPPPNFPNYYHPSFTPMPNYPAKYPQVDPTASQTHCCGCPNHVCHGTHNSKVKIDEEKPDTDQTKMPSNTYPFFWFSPRNKVQQDDIDEPKKERKEAQFPWPIVWMPEEEIKEKEKKDTQFPWPIIWMPEDDAKEKKDQHATKQASEEAAKPSFRVIPLKFLENAYKNQDEKQKLPVLEKKQVTEEAGKEWTEREHKGQNDVKRIPVMEKKEDCEKVGKEPPVKESENTGGKVTEKKHSKLPPVCLKVDPFPHKRPTNGSSKEDKNKKEVKVVDIKSANDERRQKEIGVKKDIKEKLPERKNDDVKTIIMPEEDKIKKEIKAADGRGEEGKELKGREIQGEGLKDKLEEGKVESVKRSQISEQDAAVLIQSVYRGYNVRRWDPLEKLKKIRIVHEKAQEVLVKLQRVEESAIRLEKKEQLVLGESIMNLLLQLDTIQGLHPIVREARKSVARELVSLQEKLDSLEKRKAVETPTNEVPQPQLEVQPTATTVSSEGCKSVSEQAKLQPTEAPTMECMTTQKEDEKAHESLKEADSEVKPNVPQFATDFDPVEEMLVKDLEDSSGPTQEESQMTPLVEEAKPTDLLPETIAGGNYPEAQLCPPHTENSQDVGSTENVELNSTETVPSVTVDSSTAELVPAVTLSESRAAASDALSESEMHDTSVTSSITEEIHDTEVAPGVAVTDGVDTAALLPETKDLNGIGYEEEVHAHATGSDAKETAPEVTLSETTTKEVNLVEESHGVDAGASMENVEWQVTEDGKPSNEENKVEDHDIASDDAVTASPEVKMLATEVLLEGHVNNSGANVEKVELLATEADKVEENESVEENQVTDLPGNEVTSSLPGNEVTSSLPGNQVTSLPENENSEGFQKLVEVNEPEAEVHPYAIQTNAVEVPPEVEVTDHASEVDKLSLEEKKLVEENEKLRDMLEKLMEAGRNQLDVISGLNERVKGLEKKLERKSKKSKVRVKKHKPVMAS